MYCLCRNLRIVRCMIPQHKHKPCNECWPISSHTQCKLPTRRFKAQVIFQIFIQAKPLFKQYKLWQSLVVVLGLNLLRSEQYTFYSCFGDRNGKFWAWFVFPCYLSYLGRLTCNTSSWQPPSPLVSSSLSMVYLLSVYVTRTMLICKKITINIQWKFKIQTGFTMICSSEPLLYITT